MENLQIEIAGKTDRYLFLSRGTSINPRICKSVAKKVCWLAGYLWESRLLNNKNRGGVLQESFLSNKTRLLAPRAYNITQPPVFANHEQPLNNAEAR